MKQFGIGIGVAIAAGIATLGAYFVLGSPTNPYPAQVSQSNVAEIPRGIGFDFYVLSLSWSPTYCEDSQARKRDVAQCNGPRPFAFVVHGLWPQFERGYPRGCETTQSRPSSTQARAMLDIMPSERLVQHQWSMHGTCSGLSARDYLAITRAARERVTIPDSYASAPDRRQVKAGEVEAAFIAVNPGMRSDGIGVTRRGNNLSEVRICLSHKLTPRPCLEIDQKGAGDNERLAMPPSRG